MKEIRLAEIRTAAAAADAKDLILEGVAIVFDTPTIINDVSGSYTEIIRAGALDQTDLSDVHLFYNHDANKVPLARTPKTMELKASTVGLEFKATLPNTESAREVYEAVKRGDLSGCSFAFTVPEGGDEYDPATNTRTIHKIAKLYECSVVPFPAYPQTSVEARNAQTDSLNKYKARQNLKRLCNQIIMKDEV